MFKFGMIGCGSAAEIRGGLGIRLSKVAELVAVADVDGELARKYAEQHGVPRWYTSGHELIDDPEVDGIYIATPNKFHHPYSIAAARAGKQVLCEKPFGTSLEENLEMIEECRKANVLLSVSYYRRFYPNVQRAKRLIDSGAIGTVTLAGIHATHFLGEHHTPDEAPRRWLIERDMAGAGVFQRAGSHRIDVLVYLLGAIKEVHALTEQMGEGYDVDDASVATVRFNSGAQGFFAMHHTIRGAQTDWIEVCGTEGRILLDPLDEGRVIVETPEAREEFQDDIPEATTLPIIDDFVRAVETGSPTICPAEEALKTNRVIYTGYRSSVEGRSLTVGT
jgi:predicted dehydrogenase